MDKQSIPSNIVMACLTPILLGIGCSASDVTTTPATTTNDDGIGESSGSTDDGGTTADPDPSDSSATESPDPSDGEATEVPEVFPPDPWVAPNLLVDDDFPNGVLNFATDRQFVDFYRALDGANGSNTSAVAASMNFSAEDTADATLGYATLVVELMQGQILDAGTCGLDGAALDGNSFIRLVGADGVEVASNDDACDGQGSRITYQAERAAAFELRLGCQGSTSCSGTLAYTVSPGPTPKQMLPVGFVSARDYLSVALQSDSPDDEVRDVDYAEFNDDLKAHLTEDEALRWLVDPDLQVVVDKHVYQLTNMGVFQVDREVLQPYRAWLAAHEYVMNTDPDFHAIPGEVSLGGGSYQVMPGVVRTVGGWGTPTARVLDDEEDGHAAPVDRTKQGQGARSAELGRIAYWYGKVNVFKPLDGTWQTDPDCNSGANIDPLKYCKEVFPDAVAVEEVPLTPKPPNLWNTAGCAEQYSSDGQNEYVCSGQPSCNQEPPVIDYATYTVGSGFDRSESIQFGNRRFVFKTQSPGFRLSIGDYEIGFHKIDIKGKLQRKKRFLGIGYWGPSYADEIVLGIDNMKLDTDYIVPYPQTYDMLTKPEFHELADYKLGNWLIKVANISFSTKIFSYPITSKNVADWISGALNEVIGNAYDNLYQAIEDNIIDAIDPTFKAKYAAYTKRIDALDDQHRLRWSIGHAERPQCYSHQNTWVFDANGGIKLTQNGGVQGPPGTPPAPVNYKYDMKAGSFYGRARIGTSWFGIRIVRQ